LVRVVLGPQGLQGLLEPLSGLISDDDCDQGRCRWLRIHYCPRG
jgi:hypothetical protein